MVFSPDTGPIWYNQSGNIIQYDTSLNQVDSTSISGGGIYGGIDVRPDGSFYVSNGGTVAKMNPDGTKAWESSNFSGDYIDDILYEPTNNQVYAVGGVEVIAFDDADGSTLWEVFPIGNPNSLTYDRWNDRIVAAGYVGNKDNSIAALNPADGSVVWGHNPDTKVDGVAAVRNSSQSRTEFCVHHSDADSVHRVYADSGTYQYLHNQGGISAQGSTDFDSSGYTDSGHYYVGFPDDSTQKFDKSDMSIVFRTFPVNANSRGMDISPNKFGEIFASYRGQGIHKINPTDGSLVASASPGGYDAGSVAYPRYEVHPDAWTFSPPFYYAGFDGNGYDAYNPGGTKTSENGTPSGRVWDIDASADGSEVYVLNDTNDTLYKYDKSGNQVWSSSIGSVFGVALDEANNRVYSVDQTNNALVEVDTTDGTQLNSYSGVISGNAYGVEIHDGDIFVIASGSAGRYTTSGTTVWERSGATASEVSPDPLYSIGVDDGVLAVGGFEGTVYALDPSDGSDLWNVPIAGNQIRGIGVNSNGTVAVGNYEPAIYEYDSAGNQNWRYTPRDNIGGIDISNGGGVFAGDSSGWVYELSGTGTLNTEFQPDTNGIESITYEEEPITVSKVTASQTTVNSSMNAASAVVPIIRLDATQASVSASMNGTTATPRLALNATQATVSASQNNTVVNLALNATQPSATAAMPTLTPDESLASTQFVASATPNEGSITRATLSASQPSVSAFMNSTEAEGIVFIQARQPTLSASENDTTIFLSLNASQTSADAAMNSTSLTSFITASQPRVRASMNAGAITIPHIIRLGEVKQAVTDDTANVSTVSPTSNESTIEDTENEVN